jgi:acyl-CoA synthetase (NDP forming)
MTDGELAAVLFFTTLSGIATAIGFAVAWRREQRRHDDTVMRLAEVERTSTSLQTLQAAIHSVAVEVERIGEIERFAVQHMASRSAQSEPRRLTANPAPRVVTPH